MPPLRPGRVLFTQQRLPRQFHAVMLVDGDHLDLDMVADLANIIDLTDVFVVQLTNMTEAVAAGQNLDESRQNP